ncbi:MAG TPA: helix-turn-helix transcriptional regulator, partial [Thermoleophilaceae bacterium]|nr:helix-turn-helix transcriptional regulator [Thermoleophilaceae bacterium]
MSPAVLIREARRTAGLTQQDLAGRLGITQGAVAHMERPGSNPTVARLDEVLRATGARLSLTATAHASSIDETLIARSLRMSP